MYFHNIEVKHFLDLGQVGLGDVGFFPRAYSVINYVRCKNLIMFTSKFEVGFLMDSERFKRHAFIQGFQWISFIV
jgi:hypothetical protein